MLTTCSSSVPLLVALTLGGGPAQVGQWLPPTEWDVIAIHAATLPTGEVLHWSYPDQTDIGSRARLWDPASGLFTEVNMSTDIFCAGLSMLANGFVYVTGGNDYNCPEGPQGRPTTHVFDPFTRAWTPLGLMSNGRWYPTNLTAGDGSVFILSGLDLFCALNPVMEIFRPESGLETVLGGERAVVLFPRLHLLTSGKIAHVGEENATYTFDPVVGLWEFVAHSNLVNQLANPSDRCEGTSVLLPGRTDQIMIIGGNCPLTSSVEIIDFSSPTPQWQFTTPMNHARAHADALILPDQTVLVVGGGTTGTYQGPVLTPELFDPQTETWQELPPHTYGRMYHATTVLLADGRVLVAGQDDGPSAFTGEIYLPAYLFRGARPQITTVPSCVAYGGQFTVGTPQAAEIGSVALLAPSTVTHSTNPSQRYVGLSFNVTAGDELLVTGPPNGNHAPPGYYMLFIVNQQGVPSVAEFVRVAEPSPADVNGDGIVNVLDLIEVLLCFEQPATPGCESQDINGDGTVNVLDLIELLLAFGQACA